MLFKILVELEIEIESRLRSIDKYNYDFIIMNFEMIMQK